MVRAAIFSSSQRIRFAGIETAMQKLSLTRSSSFLCFWQGELSVRMVASSLFWIELLDIVAWRTYAALFHSLTAGTVGCWL